MQPTFQLSGSTVFQRPMSGTAKPPTFSAASPSSAVATAADELSTIGGEEAGAEHRRHVVRFRR